MSWRRNRRGDDRRTRRRRCIRFVLGASLLGGAALALFASRGERLEHSSIPLSDAPAPATTVFESSQRRPQQGATAIERHEGGPGPEPPTPPSPPTPPPPPPPPAQPTIVEPVVEDLGAADRVSVYVYDDVPELDYSGLIECYRDRHDGVPPWQDEQADMAQDMGEIWLHRALLSHPWRVLDPEEADLFYLPVYPVLSFKVELGRARPFAAPNSTRIEENRCGGLTHTARMDAAVEYLSLSSPFFNRFGGADHVIVCAWWNCKSALGASHRMLLRRTVVGINEKNYSWCRWGCGAGRIVTVPYTASSVLTTSDMIGGRPAEERDIPFFFVGAARNRPERQNLDVVANISADSVILLGGNALHWGMNSTEYAEHMSRSRFCFCPRGDSPSSRRFFDALSAGCIPIITEGGVEVLPYAGTGMDYSDLAIVVDREAFSSRGAVTNTTLDVLTRSEKELAELRFGLTAGRSSIVYGVSTGAGIGDMHPFLGTATKFLQASHALAGGGGGGAAAQERVKVNMWACPSTGQPEAHLALRTKAKLPPVPWERRQWLAESETIVNKEHSLLFCAPPNTGSLQFRMLAKRMQGVSHWSVADDWSLLFDPTASELELLDVTDGPLMKEIYSHNGSGWIKIAVVRDPVTRLLSAYLDIVRTWRAGLKKHEEEQSVASSPLTEASDGSAQEQGEQSGGHDRERRLRPTESNDEGARHEETHQRETPLGGTSSEWDLFEAVLERLQQRPQAGTARSGNDEVTAARNDHREEPEEEDDPFSWEDSGDWHGSFAGVAEKHSIGGEERTQDHANRALDAGELLFGDDVVHIPTFAEVVDTLKVKPWKAPPAFRPSTTLCGQQSSPFDSVIPFERLQNTSTAVLKSLPGEIWESFGASGWGPDGMHAFMEFDYGGAAWRRNVVVHAEDAQQEGIDEDPRPQRASDLFEGESCEWAEYYGDMKTLETMSKLYEVDYNHFRWYQLGPWRERLQGCIDRKNR